MEDDQEVKHICRFCYKSFSCGRSLGGHMRSHLPNTTESSEKLSRKKLSTFSIHDEEETEFKDSGAQNAYSLRENQKKTTKFASASEDDCSLDDNKLCKECGKEFPSWKALFGHMKRHSDNFSNSIDGDSLNGADEKLVMVMDSDSDNEVAAPIRKQRSSRSFKRYRSVATTTTATTTTNALLINDSSCFSEIEQEQEEVALSLILLSRNVTSQRGGWKSIVDSSENNNSEFHEAFSDAKSESKNLKCSENGVENSKTFKMMSPINTGSKGSAKLELNNCLDSDSLKSKIKQSEHQSSTFSRNREAVESRNSEASRDAFLKDTAIKKTEEEKKNQSHQQEPEFGSTTNDESKKPKRTKRKHNALHHVQEMSGDHSMKLVSDNASDSQVISHQGSDKRIKFECTSCNKTFHSYQALGGHRASHKKKACFGSKIDSTENSTETEVSPNQTADSKFMTTSYRTDNSSLAKSAIMPQNLGSCNVTARSAVMPQNLVPCSPAARSAVTPQDLVSCNATAKIAVMSQNLGSCNAIGRSAVTPQNSGSGKAAKNLTGSNANDSIPRPRVFDPKFKSRKVIISDSGIKKLTNQDCGLSKRNNRLHECPICFKIFPSGQAFGGHKRSHLIAEAKSNSSKQMEADSSGIIGQKQIPEKIRDFLDLNLPAPEQEESTNDQVIYHNNPWWMASNHKREPLHVGTL